MSQGHLYYGRKLPCLVTQAILLQQLSKGGTAQAEFSGCVGDIAVIACKGLPDKVYLDCRPCFPECVQFGRGPQSRESQIFRRQQRAQGHNHRPSNPVLEFSHITWPVIDCQRCQGMWAEAADLVLTLWCIAVQQGLGQYQDILT